MESLNNYRRLHTATTSFVGLVALCFLVYRPTLASNVLKTAQINKCVFTTEQPTVSSSPCSDFSTATHYAASATCVFGCCHTVSECANNASMCARMFHTSVAQVLTESSSSSYVAYSFDGGSTTTFSMSSSSSSLTTEPPLPNFTAQVVRCRIYDLFGERGHGQCFSMGDCGSSDECLSSLSALYSNTSLIFTTLLIGLTQIRAL